MLLKTDFSHLGKNYQSEFFIVKNLTGLLAQSLWHLWHEACPKKVIYVTLNPVYKMESVREKKNTYD